MSKHTKGPWEAHETEVYFPHCAGGLSVRHCPDAEANARLIAAAPELLEALERLIKLRDDGLSNDYYLFKDAIDAAREIANKARGEA